MLPSKFRLKLPPRWNRNFPDFKTSNPLFKIICKKTDNSQNPKIGFVISTKVGKAVERNRIRRRLETLLLPRLNEATSPFEIIFIAHPGITKATNEELNTSLNQALSKIRFQ